MSAPRLLRPGGLAREEIESVLGHQLIAGAMPGRRPMLRASSKATMRRRRSLRLDAEGGTADGEIYLGFRRDVHGAYNLSPRGDLVEAAANLFRLLHEIDATGVASDRCGAHPASGAWRSHQ